MTIPLAPQHRRSRSVPLTMSLRMRIPSSRRIICLLLGTAYPTIILIAIVATANHFVLDAVAGAMVCGLAWHGNRMLLNLIPLEDYFLCLVRIHKPERKNVSFEGDEIEDLGYGRMNGASKELVID